jgi:hypothetical protein
MQQWSTLWDAEAHLWNISVLQSAHLSSLCFMQPWFTKQIKLQEWINRNIICIQQFVVTGRNILKIQSKNWTLAVQFEVRLGTD